MVQEVNELICVSVFILRFVQPLVDSMQLTTLYLQLVPVAWDASKFLFILGYFGDWRKKKIIAFNIIPSWQKYDEWLIFDGPSLWFDHPPFHLIIFPLRNKDFFKIIFLSYIYLKLFFFLFLIILFYFFNFTHMHTKL